ncbi:MRPS9 family protein [Megaselia abdita]
MTSLLNGVRRTNSLIPLLKQMKITFSTETVQAAPLAVNTQKVSKAMKAYLERAQEHDNFMKAQTIEFQIGKRHLANIMGADPENFTQEDIDEAIEYLFPSGLFDKKARPMMKAPEEIFPSRKAAEFDETGRPFHSMFYTGKPNFFQLLHNIVAEIRKAQYIEDKMIQRGRLPAETDRLDMTGFAWLSKTDLEKILVETISDLEYNNFLNTMNRLAAQPAAFKCREFALQYAKPLIDQSKISEIPKPQFDENGKQFITTYECLRKTARADVTIRFPGTGKVTINKDHDITYFKHVQSREQVLFPMIFINQLGKFDVEANVEGGGVSGQAGAIRWGIAMGLRSFVDSDVIEDMRVAGLLTRDYRRRERKKPGQEGARRKYTWKKR